MSNSTDDEESPASVSDSMPHLIAAIETLERAQRRRGLAEVLTAVLRGAAEMLRPPESR